MELTATPRLLRCPEGGPSLKQNSPHPTHRLRCAGCDTAQLSSMKIQHTINREPAKGRGAEEKKTTWLAGQVFIAPTDTGIGEGFDEVSQDDKKVIK